MLAISRFSAPLAVFIFNAGVAVAEPVTVAITKAPVERLVARGCWKTPRVCTDRRDRTATPKGRLENESREIFREMDDMLA